MKNREFSFRIRDKKHKQFCDPEFGILTLDQIFTCDDNYVFQQFTGLHDKNGKKIYEGDILDYSHYGSPTFLEVYWNEQLAEFNTKIHQLHSKIIYDIHSITMYELNNYEIVGNIYQNKELLCQDK